MAWFGSSEKSKNDASNATLAPAVKQIEDQINQELASANAAELTRTITENCFNQCIQNPGPAQTPDQSRCVNQCVEKYMRSWNVVSKTYVSRILNQ